MEDTVCRKLLHSEDDLKPEFKLPKLSKKIPLARKERWQFRLLVFAFVATCLLSFGLLLNVMLLQNPALDDKLVQFKRCPACFGQSACPSFFRGQVNFKGIYGTKAMQVYAPGEKPIQEGYPGTMGWYDAAYDVFLRRLASPGSDDAIDQAVCRRGLPVGAADAPQDALKFIKCKPNLAMYRWRATGGSEHANFIEDKLTRSFVASRHLTGHAKIDSNLTSLAFAPFTRCASDRLFNRIMRNFRERTSPGAETRWLLFDELLLLFNLAINPTAIVEQTFPSSVSRQMPGTKRASNMPKLQVEDGRHKWPFPVYHGACGSWIVEENFGRPLNNFAEAPVWLRKKIMLNLLSLPEQLSTQPVPEILRVEKSLESGNLHARLEQDDSDFGYSIYLADFAWSAITVNPFTYEVAVSDLRHVIAVDTQSQLEYNVTPKNYTVDANKANELVAWGMSNNNACYGNLTGTGDAGGTTPPCLDTKHAESLCEATWSDHNHWAVCALIKWGSGDPKKPGFDTEFSEEFQQLIGDCLEGNGDRLAILSKAKSLLV